MYTARRLSNAATMDEEQTIYGVLYGGKTKERKPLSLRVSDLVPVTQQSDGFSLNSV
jgi:hypothetical protein